MSTNEFEIEYNIKPNEFEIETDNIQYVEGLAEEKDPTVPRHVKDITEQDIQKWNNVDELDNVLKDILEAIQNGTSSSMIIEEIEQLIVSYFENKTVGEVEA